MPHVFGWFQLAFRSHLACPDTVGTARASMPEAIAGEKEERRVDQGGRSGGKNGTSASRVSLRRLLHGYGLHKGFFEFWAGHHVD